MKLLIQPLEPPQTKEAETFSQGIAVMLGDDIVMAVFPCRELSEHISIEEAKNYIAYKGGNPSRFKIVRFQVGSK